jgi:hypothetical protein
MSQPSDDKEPVVEPSTSDNQPDDLTGRALRQRIRQQELLAELGVLALQRTGFISMLNHTARVTAEGLGAEYCKVLEYIPADNRLLVRAGVGWEEGVVGSASVGADLASPAGYALRTGKPVISNHLANEQRFRTPELLVEHGIRRAMNVILQGDGAPFGVLEVDSTSEGEFGEHDIAFLQGAANILGMAIEQQQYQRKLQVALDRHQVLLKEVNHRVKNSLQVVTAMLQLQANSVGDPALSERLNEASSRVNAVGRLMSVSLIMPTTRTLNWLSICAKLSATWSRRSLRVKSSLRRPRKFRLQQIELFLWGLSSMSSFQMRASMPILIVPAD